MCVTWLKGQVERRPEVTLRVTPKGCVTSSRPSLPRVKSFRERHAVEAKESITIKTILGLSPCPISPNPKPAYLELKCSDTDGGLVGGRILGF